MSNYYLVFYADSDKYKNKRFKFSMQFNSWLPKSYELLDRFFEAGNTFRTAFLLIDHVNKSGEIIESQRITIPTDRLYVQKSSQ